MESSKLSAGLTCSQNVAGRQRETSKAAGRSRTRGQVPPGCEASKRQPCRREGAQTPSRHLSSIGSVPPRPDYVRPSTRGGGGASARGQRVRQAQTGRRTAGGQGHQANHPRLAPCLPDPSTSCTAPPKKAGAESEPQQRPRMPKTPQDYAPPPPGCTKEGWRAGSERPEELGEHLRPTGTRAPRGPRTLAYNYRDAPRGHPLCA